MFHGVFSMSISTRDKNRKSLYRDTVRVEIKVKRKEKQSFGPLGTQALWYSTVKFETMLLPSLSWAPSQRHVFSTLWLARAVF